VDIFWKKELKRKKKNSLSTFKEGGMQEEIIYHRGKIYTKRRDSTKNTEASTFRKWESTSIR